MERHSLRTISGESPETMRKLCLYQEIRRNYGNFRNGFKKIVNQKNNSIMETFQSNFFENLNKKEFNANFFVEI